MERMKACSNVSPLFLECSSCCCYAAAVAAATATATATAVAVVPQG